jgi:hypothetical protein
MVIIFDIEPQFLNSSRHVTGHYAYFVVAYRHLKALINSRYIFFWDQIRLVHEIHDENESGKKQT